MSEHAAENGAPRWRPVRPWQHWRFALTVTFCWLARRHSPCFVRKSERGFVFYRCRVCRSNMVDTRTRPIPPGGVIDPRDGEVCCSNPASCAGTAGPGTEGCHISPGSDGAA